MPRRLADWSRSVQAAAVAAVVVLGAGCSSGASGPGDDAATSSAPAATSASASPSSTASPSAPASPGTASDSASAELPAPVIVEPGQTTAEAHVGETIVFNQPDPANTTIGTDRPDVLKLFQGRDDGSALFNPGAEALAPGVAVVTIRAADGSTSEVTVTVR